MRCTALATLLASGCLSIPPYEPEVAVSYTAAGTGATVSGPGFELQFAGGDAFHYPDELRIDGINVLGREPAAGCFDPDEAGILIAPTPRISAHGAATQVTNRLTPTLRGPAVVQVTLDWATRMSCNSARLPRGSSVFTVFPDGRIVRYDVLVDPSSAEIAAGDCACDKNADGADGFTVSAFWTLTRSGFADLRAPQPVSLPLVGETVSTNAFTACLGGNAFQVAFAWRDSNTTTVTGGNTLITFGRDLLFRNSVLHSYMWDNSTALFIERSDCATALARADDHVDAPPLSINGALVSPAARDGIYGSPDTDGDRALQLATDRVELSGTTSSSFAVWLRFPHAVDAVRATLEGKSGPWYLPQQVDAATWIFWFRYPILSAQKIIIEPR